MTSVESHHHIQQQEKEAAVGLQYGLDVDVDADAHAERRNVMAMDGQSISPRFEAFVMTGSKILPTGRVSKTNIRQAETHTKQISPTNNIVLHSPVLKKAILSARGEREEDDDQEVIFQYRTHDVHHFELKSGDASAEVKGEVEKDDGRSPVSCHDETSQSHGLDHEIVLYKQRPFTPEIVDDRPVWTVNAPISKHPPPLTKSLPASPSPRRSGGQQQRFREILREETIITDTTISELTDTATSTSYILNSPRTPRHAPRAVEELAPSLAVCPVESEEVVMQPKELDKAPPSPEAVPAGQDGEDGGQVDDLQDGHLEKEPASQLFVHPESAHACMEMFQLEGMRLDDALRLFLRQVKLSGENTTRQRLIDLFSIRYVALNPGLLTRDSANGLVSGMLILNSDLYSQHRPHHPMSMRNFIESLHEMPACTNIPEEELQRLYTSIKSEALPVAQTPINDGQPVGQSVESGIEKGACCKSGYLIRKSCRQVGGKPTKWGSRGWHRSFIVLNQMSLEVFKKEPTKEDEVALVSSPLHHAYATLAKDYCKHPLVLRFRAIDDSVVLFRASSQEDLDSWMKTINRTAARNSAPVSLPVGSQTIIPSLHSLNPRTLLRPLYASRKSGLTAAEHVIELKESEARLLGEIRTLNTEEPKSRSEVLFMSAQLDFYSQELERTQTYLRALERQ